MSEVRRGVSAAKVKDDDFLPAASALDYLGIGLIGDVARELEKGQNDLPSFVICFLKSANFAEIADGAAINYLTLYIAAGRGSEVLYGMLKMIAPTGSDERDLRKTEAILEHFKVARR